MSSAVFDLATLLRVSDRDLPRELVERYTAEIEAGENGDRRMIALLNYVFAKYHVKRNELNMYRDMAKVGSMLALRFSDRVVPIDLALDECRVTSYDIIDEILRTPPNGYGSLDEFLADARSTKRLQELRLLLEDKISKNSGDDRGFLARYASRVFYSSLKRYLVALGMNCNGYFERFAASYERCDESDEKRCADLLRKRAYTDDGVGGDGENDALLNKKIKIYSSASSVASSSSSSELVDEEAQSVSTHQFIAATEIMDEGRGEEGVIEAIDDSTKSNVSQKSIDALTTIENGGEEEQSVEVVAVGASDEPDEAQLPPTLDDSFFDYSLYDKL